MKTNTTSTSCRQGFAGLTGGFFRATEARLPARLWARLPARLWARLPAPLWALLLAVGAGLAVPVAHAVHPMVVLEDSYELKPADTRWPDTARGTVVLPGCVRCKQDRYVLGASARFLVGQQPASYREFLGAVRGRSASAVFIAIERSTGEVSRATVMP